jgi:hypothetical protein
MNVRTFALIFGIVFLLVGIAGFIPGLSAPHDAAALGVHVDHGAGLLLGLFPVNTLHNLVHVAFGVWGLAVFRNASSAVLYARGVAIIYALFTVMGLIPGLSTTFGLVPLYGNDIWLHALLGAVAAYFGFVRPREAVTPASRGV